MMVYMDGGPSDGQLIEIQDALRTIVVPGLDKNGRFLRHEYEVTRVFGKMGNKTTGAAVYKGIRGAPDVLIGEDGKQKQETSPVRAFAGGDADSVDIQEPERGLPSPAADKPNRKRANAPGADGRSPRCRRESRDK